MKTIFPLIAFALFFVLGFFGIKKGISMVKSEPEPTSSTWVLPELEKVSQKLNESLPTQLDAHTRFDSTSAGPGSHFTYNYTITNPAKGTFGSSSFEAKQRKHLVQTYKSSPAMAAFRDDNIELTYRYWDEKKAPLLTITISPKDF